MDSKDDDDEYDFEAQVKAFSAALRRTPHKAVQEPERLGFTYEVDDDEIEEDLAEERAARPANASQQALVAYFESKAPPDEALVCLWQKEMLCDEPNAPLWRRYFRQGNARLKALFLFGLDRDPTDGNMLNSLGFLQEFSPMLKELITRYQLACDRETDEIKFMELAQDFDGSTGDSGYDALQALASRYPAENFKARCVSQLLAKNLAEDQTIHSF